MPEPEFEVIVAFRITAVSEDDAREAARAIFDPARYDIRSVRQVGGPSDEDKIRGAMAEAKDHPGRVVTRL